MVGLGVRVRVGVRVRGRGRGRGRSWQGGCTRRSRRRREHSAYVKLVLVSLGHIILLGQQQKRRLQPDLHADKVVQRLAVGACPEPLDADIITTPERQLISDCRPVTQLGLLVRSHALLGLMQMTAASFVRVECLLQCLQNQARLARLQAGNGAPRKRSYLANRADDTVYAQQSGALTVIAQSAGGEPSCAPRLPSVSRALSSPAQCSVSARPWTPLHL